MTNKRGHGDGGIDRRSPRHYRLRWRIGGQRRTKSFHGDLADAKKELRRLLEAENPRPSSLKLANFLRKWLLEDQNLSPKTRERYLQLAEQQIIPHLGATTLQNLRPGQLTEWHAELLRAGGANGGSLTGRTVGHAHRLLHTALAHAARQELVARNVASLVHPPKIAAGEVPILSAPEITQVLAGLAAHRLLPIAALAIGAGLRRGELCALRWSDVDLDAGRLRVSGSMEQTRAGLRLKEPKTRHGRRRILLPEFAVAALREHLKRLLERRLGRGLGRPEATDWVFPLEDGSPCPPDYLSRLWKRAISARKLPRISLHGLRHSHASALIAAGVDPLTISRRLGHGTPSFTLATYGHLFADTDAAAAKAINSALGNGT
jgi:integrase